MNSDAGVGINGIGAAVRSGGIGLVAVGLVIAMAGCQSGPPPSLVEQGDAAFARGEYRTADDLYSQALADDASTARALLGRARVAVARGEGEAALRYHARLAKLDREYWRDVARQDYAGALASAGQSRLDANRAEASVEALRALRRVDPDWPNGSRLLGRALTARADELAMHGYRTEALALYQEAAGVDPGSTRAYVGAAEILIGTGRKQEALAILETAREVAPGDSRVRALTMEAMGLY